MDHRHIALGYLLGALQVLIVADKKISPATLEDIVKYAEHLAFIESGEHVERRGGVHDRNNW